MAIGKTDLLNKALTLVGSNNITSIDDSTQSARILSRVYEQALRSILSECEWNFATKRRLLAQSAETVEWYHTNEAYVYQKPVDCIRIFGVNSPTATWREEGELILADITGLGIKYVYYLDNPTKYSSSFAEAFIDKLCSDISYAIINSKTKAESFLDKYEKISKPKAMAENAQIGTQQTVRDDAWENSKYSDGGVNF